MADFHFINNEKEYVVDDFYLEYLIKNGLTEDRTADLLALSIDNQINLTKKYIEKLNSAEHRGKSDNFIQKYKFVGALKIPYVFQPETKSMLTDQFHQDNRFRGRVPGIIDSIAVVTDFYNKYNHNSNLVEKFNLNAVRTMLQAGIPPVQAVLLYERYSPEKCIQLCENKQYIEDICAFLIKGTKKNLDSYLNAADWITDHLNTDSALIEKIIKETDKLDLIHNTTIDGIKVQLSNLKATKEKDKVEKAYKKPKFKLSECTCELKDVQKEVIHNRLMAYIMHPQDERQLILGQATNCCQKLGDAGESSMMHGLLNPKAGFFVIQDQNTGEIKAQAEIWEENENTLVFDNIEYANDCDISLYKDILGKWLEETSYLNVKMGSGYNGLISHNQFRSCGSVTPTITAREAYVMSYEDEIEIPNGREELECLESEEEAQRLIDSGEITYYTYLYCDSENEAVWLKENGQIENYFMPDPPELVALQTLHENICQLTGNYYENNTCVMIECSDIYSKLQNNEITYEQYLMNNRPVFTCLIYRTDNESHMGHFLNSFTLSLNDVEAILDPNNNLSINDIVQSHTLNYRISPLVYTFKSDELTEYEIDMS